MPTFDATHPPRSRTRRSRVGPLATVCLILLAAAVGLFGMAVSPFVYISVNIWRTIHPLNTVVPTLQPGMRGPFWFCAAAFLLLFVVLLNLRMSLAREQALLDELYLAEEDAA